MHCMHALAPDQIQDILQASRLGVLALSHDNDSYAIPLYYGYDGDALYFHCHPGVKDEWIETDRRACLVVIHVESENIWESVQVFGAVEKLSLSSDIEKAKSALFTIPFPPAEGYTQSGNPVRTDQDVYYLRLRPDEMTGKGSTFKQ